MFSQRLFFPWVAALSPATSYHSTVSLKALISKVEKLSRKSQSRMCGRGSVPCKQPSGRHPKPRVGSTGTPTGGSCHSLSFQLPFPAIIPCCSGSSTLDVQSSPPAKGSPPQIPVLCSTVEGLVGNFTVSALLHEGHLWVLVCVSPRQDVVSRTLVLRGRVILRYAKAYFGFRSLYICHSSYMHQSGTFSEKLSLTQNIPQSLRAEWIHRLPVPEQSQAEVGRWEWKPCPEISSATFTFANRLRKYTGVSSSNSSKWFLLRL